MSSQPENNTPLKFTIFKPPAYIYKLSKIHSKHSQKPTYEIYYNKDHSLRKYVRSLNLSNQSQLQLFQWRKNTSSPIVKVVYLQLIQKSSSSLNIENNIIDLNVYTEHIQKYLADMINLNLNQAVYILKQCIIAFNDIFQQISAVSINKFHIGLNAEGILKIWINQNLAFNHSPQKLTQTQKTQNEVLIVQTAIVNKIIHMISLLSCSNCKFFFFGLLKELTLKRFLFNNCLQYINNFIANTKNFQVPNNLSYMLPKKTSFCLQKSNVRVTNSQKQNLSNKQRKLSENLSFANISTFKNFGSFVRTNNRQNTQNLKMTSQNSQEEGIRPKRHSQNLPKDFFTNLNISQVKQKNIRSVQQTNGLKENKISLHIIIQKNKKTSIKSKDISETRKSNVSATRQRPSICIVPSFIAKSAKKQRNQDNERQQSYESEKKTQKSYSLQSSKSKDYNSLLNSKVASSNYQCKRRNFRGNQNINNKQNNNEQKKQFQYEKNDGLRISIRSIKQLKNIRARSASENIKFGSYKLPYHMLNLHQNNTKGYDSISKQSVSKARSLQKNCSQNNDRDKVSTNTISNDGTNKKRSFLTKTNYDSVTEDNDKNATSSRMNFSSMSIQNRITNKNFDSQISGSHKQDVKRSLVSFKYGFEEILQNPSCKQVEEENQSKSYNGSSLKNTQNLSDLIARKQRKNQDSCSNNFSFGNASNRQGRRLNLKDSVEQNWAVIKQKNEQVLLKNQWKKTINNLQQLQDLTLNQSIVDMCDQVIEKDRYSQIRLQKLDRLGRDMCYSIVKKSDEVAFSSTSHGKRLFQP